MHESKREAAPRIVGHKVKAESIMLASLDVFSGSPDHPGLSQGSGRTGHGDFKELWAVARMS